MRLNRLVPRSAPIRISPPGARRYNPVVDLHTLSALPGADLVVKGLHDLEAGTESIEALLVQVGAPKLRSLGLEVRDVASVTSRTAATTR